MRWLLCAHIICCRVQVHVLRSCETGVRFALQNPYKLANSTLYDVQQVMLRRDRGRTLRMSHPTDLHSLPAFLEFDDLAVNHLSLYSSKWMKGMYPANIVV